MTTIEWTQAPGYKGETWNPVTVCDSDVQLHADRLRQPLRWRKPRMVFVNSMPDLFHESVTDEQLDQIFAVMALTPQHIYQVLTKRPERMLEYLTSGVYGLRTFTADWLNNEQLGSLHFLADNLGLVEKPIPNIWTGVTVENQTTADERIPLLLQAPAAVRLLSCEPLLGKVDLSEHLGMFYMGLGEEACIDQVIIGGESGPKARPCDVAWIESLVKQCKAADVPAFVKQLGSNPKLQIHDCHRPPYNWVDFGSTGKGGDPAEWPEDLRVREWPRALEMAGGVK